LWIEATVERNGIVPIIMKCEWTLSRGNLRLSVASEPHLVRSKTISYVYESYEVFILTEEAELEGLLSNPYWIRQVSNLRSSARNDRSASLQL
jgi:hypothetical protein